MYHAAPGIVGIGGDIHAQDPLGVQTREFGVARVVFRVWYLLLVPDTAAQVYDLPWDI